MSFISFEFLEEFDATASFDKSLGTHPTVSFQKNTEILLKNALETFIF